jgi:hypothetical protein
MAHQTSSILIDQDHDSAYGDSDAGSETTSLRSAVYSYIYENGRRYHSYRAGAYWWVLRYLPRLATSISDVGDAEF